ncbi:hypothetical protein [Xanthomonas translucens]|uniref:hypothetical protein n=1 Tax=Xanthomonas campestris pv. translucens TaxID=343 RepID=UPI00114D3269|nr:hypothetical protein [Xanthomonas translucens]MCT8281738.1 hypothetical protein [Xanthomonas translucens pv. undulosa]MCT8316508.1 hypothetical protein [Xanthomonas translucens pv. undulosa]QEN93659.1 hypothetical protein F0H33_09950 [Xanthomonas translucens pv. undulosa]QSQ58026.1 hypothetical protein ISN37_08870 [Xanthomonas translucens pv. undulosa]UKE38257.1 hypothetical protein KCU58_10795 [Xanthomonas translucens pv. undulosa]
MNIGLRVRNKDGRIVSTINDRLSCIISQIDLPPVDAIKRGGNYYAPDSASGSIYDDRLLAGNPYFFVVYNGQRSQWGLIFPVISFSGGAMSWKWSDDAVDQKVRTEANDPSNFDPSKCVGGISIIYGVYS